MKLNYSNLSSNKAQKGDDKQRKVKIKTNNTWDMQNQSNLKAKTETARKRIYTAEKNSRH